MFILSGSKCAAIPLLIVQESLETTKDMLSKLVSDEPTLDSKIEKKKQELERNQKRFRTVQSVRSVHNLTDWKKGWQGWAQSDPDLLTYL